LFRNENEKKLVVDVNRPKILINIIIAAVTKIIVKICAKNVTVPKGKKAIIKKVDFLFVDYSW
jgi:hypothetical protein